MEQESCQNCRRRGADINLHLCSGPAVKRKCRKMYYRVEGSSPNVLLCSCCKSYLMDGQGNRPADYWPAMVYSFLSHVNSGNIKSVSFEAKWRLIPSPWKRWWNNAFPDNMQVDYQEDGGNSLFRDLTEELLDMERVMDRLRWMELAQFMDKHLAFPEVRAVVVVVQSVELLFFCRKSFHFGRFNNRNQDLTQVPVYMYLGSRIACLVCVISLICMTRSFSQHFFFLPPKFPPTSSLCFDHQDPMPFWMLGVLTQGQLCSS